MVSSLSRGNILIPREQLATVLSVVRAENRQEQTKDKRTRHLGIGRRKAYGTGSIATGLF